MWPPDNEMGLWHKRSSHFKENQHNVSLGPLTGRNAQLSIQFMLLLCWFCIIKVFLTSNLTFQSAAAITTIQLWKLWVTSQIGISQLPPYCQLFISCFPRVEYRIGEKKENVTFNISAQESVTNINSHFYFAFWCTTEAVNGVSKTDGQVDMFAYPCPLLLPCKAKRLKIVVTSSNASSWR